MKTRLAHRLVLCFAVLAATQGVSGAADFPDRSWVFSQPGNQLGWHFTRGVSSSGVDAGQYWAITDAGDARIEGPSVMNLAPKTNHYLALKMRLELTGDPPQRFGAVDCRLYWMLNAEATYTSDKSVTFKVYGNGQWKEYLIPIGNQARWNNLVYRLRLDPCPLPGARIEIGWIKIVRDLTPPEYEIEHLWNPGDGDPIRDTTPTINVRDYRDKPWNVTRVDFYWRPGASESDDDWVLAGIDYQADNGAFFEYPELEPGVYDFAVRVRDAAGNLTGWPTEEEKRLDDVLIVPELDTTIRIDAAAPGEPVKKGVFGNNATWTGWNTRYNADTGRLPEALETRLSQMGVPILRYPGGCDTSTFYWKKSIGPVAERPDMPGNNGCSTNAAAYSYYAAKFGLDEFLRLCEARGWEPMFSCRFRWPGAPGLPGYDGDDPYAEALQDAVDLVEYCNTPNDGSNPNGGTDWAAVRAANGHPEPYNVKLFEIGNEPWGADPFGSPAATTSDHASAYAVPTLTYIEQMKAVDPTIQVAPALLPTFPRDMNYTEPGWTQSVLEQIGFGMDHAQIHPYYPYSAWQTDLVKLYDETMATPKHYDDQWDTIRTQMRQTVPERVGKLKLWVSEWDINYNWWEDEHRINRYHTRTLKAAIAAAETYRVFVENSDLIDSSEWWHLYGSGPWGCIASDNTTVYPIFHVLRMYNSHFGDRLVGAKVTGSPNFDFNWEPGSIIGTQLDVPYVTAIASISEDGESLFLIVINKDRLDAHQAFVQPLGFPEEEYLLAEVWEMNGPDVDDYLHPQLVTTTERLQMVPESFEHTFPAHSVTSFRFWRRPAEGPVVSISEARQAIPGTQVAVAADQVTAVFEDGTFYVEQTDRATGIRVEAPASDAYQGAEATVVGILQANEHGELYIDAEGVAVRPGGEELRPLFLSQKEFTPWGAVSTSGLLVSVWGYVTAAGDGYCFVDDGTRLRPSVGERGIKVRVGHPPQVGQLVRVTGIRSQERSSPEEESQPVILTRGASDVVVLY